MTIQNWMLISGGCEIVMKNKSTSNLRDIYSSGPKENAEGDGFL